MSESSPASTFSKWIRESISARVLFVGVLILLLLIPLAMVQDVIRERESRSNEAIREVSYKWGNAQTIGGPALIIPVQLEKSNPDENESKYYINNIVVLPNQLDYKADVKAEERKRGIYSIPLYQADIAFRGHIETDDILKAIGKDNGVILWDRARVLLKVSDVKGLRTTPKLLFNGESLEFNPRSEGKFIGGEALVANIENFEGGRINFQGSISINGTNSLGLLPLGSITNGEIRSNWSHPKFIGDYITSETPQVGEGQSAGSWQVLEMNRGYARIFHDYDNSILYNNFGVELMKPVDHYTMSERSAKYGILIISLTFIAFLLIQLVVNLKVHTIQYLMVGFGLVLFYLLLVAFSERIGFSPAYLIASIMTTALITWYAHSIYKKRNPTIALGSTLVLTYGFLFVVMQLEDVALLIGALILFIALGVLMYFTRKIPSAQA
ncbi:cell envelope integrity protein CreD [Phaeocystidibacter luteus]|uniref:Cell envelope integrity protein CreD n=1 Tax=Phaeocystidibacter luteus TaxID=911197 RepID=A0A6N6RM53_9FLAO|nr:cell envelope integrity protein CreD [Phaeocystidibacter luteus]KAB2814628.1 cell envelope integrity protein CreD [Phaeocystidibacter luteus]